MTDVYDFSILKRPRWILAIIVGLGLSLLFLRLGVWQLQRLDERQARNETIVARLDEPMRPLMGLIADHGGDGALLAHRRTTIVGTYRADEEFMSIGRVYGDIVGSLVATPLDLEDGTVVIVLRGIVPAGTDGPPALGYEVPRAEVVLEGIIGEGEAPLRMGEPDPPSGTIESLSRIDLGYIREWLDGDVLSFTLLLGTQTPASADEPIRIPPEELSDGSHLGYAIQWFAFSIIVSVGVGALLLRAARGDAIVEISADPDHPG